MATGMHCVHRLEYFYPGLQNCFFYDGYSVFTQVDFVQKVLDLALKVNLTQLSVFKSVQCV